jgi:predicted Rossmann-fold nucleotide-binding protein
MPGGFGTLDEFFEVLTLVQTQRIPRFPLILFGRDYWSGLVRWMKSVWKRTRTSARAIWICSSR